jgi:hypothetical protein
MILKVVTGGKNSPKPIISIIEASIKLNRGKMLNFFMRLLCSVMERRLINDSNSRQKVCDASRL